MIRALFVDDEPKLLHGMKTMLFGTPAELKIHAEFALGGHAALEILSKESFDVIVTDMNMPIMDGEKLLAIVAKQWPLMSRIVLSGRSESHTVYRVLPYVHDFLSKPCALDELLFSIVSAVPRHDLVSNSVLANGYKLPPRPGLLAHCQRLLDNNAPMSQLAEAIESDIAASTFVMRAANMSFFENTRASSTPTEALSQLGSAAVVGLLAHFATQRLVTNIDPATTELVNAHSLSIAKSAVAIAGKTDQLFVSALLHDVGTLLILAYLDDKPDLPSYEPDLWDARADEEQDRFGFNHAILGSLLLELWGFDEVIVQVVREHANPSALPFELQHFASTLVEAHARNPVVPAELLTPVGRS